MSPAALASLRRTSVLHRKRRRAAGWQPTAPSSATDLLSRSLAAAGGSPDPWQLDVTGSASRRQVVVAARQSGKSTCIGSRVMYAAAMRDDVTSVILSASERQAKELTANLARLVPFLGPAGRDADVTSSQITLANGSRVICLASSSNSVRGWTVSGWDPVTRTGGVLVVDESAYVDPATWHAVGPLVVAQGGAVMLASSAGVAGHWCHAVHTDPAKHPDYERHTVTGYDIARYDRAFLEAERLHLPDDVFAAEYMGAWRSTVADAVIESLLIDRVFGQDDSAPTPSDLAEWARIGAMAA